MADSYRIAAFVNEDFGKGLALAGVEIVAVHDSQQALERLREAYKNRSWGIIIVDEELIEGIEERERNALFEQTIPLVIAVPASMRWQDVEQVSSDDFVSRLIRRAVGYQLNIQV